MPHAAIYFPIVAITATIVLILVVKKKKPRE
jgi:hypothetical protein